MQGPIGGVSSANPPPCLHHAPLQLQPTTTRVPPATAPPLRSAPPGGMPHDFRGSHGRLSRWPPRPPRGQPQALTGTGGQGPVVRMVAAAKLPLPPAAGPPQPWAAGSTQPPTRAASSPSTWPHVMGPAASLTTARVAASCPLLACSSSSSYAWRHCAISSSVSGGGHCLHGVLLPPGPPAGGHLPPLLLGFAQ